MSIAFHEPNGEKYVRNTHSALDVRLSTVEQKYADFKPNVEGNVCGDMTLTIWDIYPQENNRNLLDNERKLYGIYG